MYISDSWCQILEIKNKTTFISNIIRIFQFSSLLTVNQENNYFN